MSVTNQRLSRAISENPFYRMSATFNASLQIQKLDEKTVSKTAVFSLLDASWAECKDDKQKRELFFVLVFSIGDIQNREHNLFRKRNMRSVEGGGHSNRRAFMYCLEWILTRIPQQFYAFLSIIGEYYNLDGTMLYELRTDRWKGTLKETLRLPIDVNLVTNHIAETLRLSRTTDNEKMLWARWLPHVPTTSRRRKYEITEKNVKAFQKGGHAVEVGGTIVLTKPKKSHTVEKDKWTIDFIAKLSDKMDWQVIKHKHNVEFKGYAEFKKKHLANSEATMFSSQRIKELDKQQLLDWFNQLPSGARYRVARRVANKDKQGRLTSNARWVTNTGQDVGQVYIEWTKLKEEAQQKLRNLTTEQKKEIAPQELKQMEKAAKVNVGAETIMSSLLNLFKGSLTRGEFNLEAQSILDKVKLEVPVLVCVDTSSSMTQLGLSSGGLQIQSTHLAQLMATVFLLKNPDEELGKFFLRFDDICEVITDEQSVSVAGSNRYTQSKDSIKVRDLVDRKRDFASNLESVSKYVLTRGSTHLTSIAKGLNAWANQDPQFKSTRIEWINRYPVYLILSDGDLNSHGFAQSSMLAFQADMRNYFGWEGVVALWDLKEPDKNYKSYFEGMNNVIHLTGVNPNNLTQIFTKITDMDVIDTYLPLKTLHASNRYMPVKELVL